MTTDAYQREYDRLRQLGIAQMAQGLQKDAEDTCRKALALARGQGDQDLADLATCNLSFVLIDGHRGQEIVSQLQQILMRSTSNLSRHLAAYNISLQYDRLHQFNKSQRYARIALTHAQDLRSDELRARSHNRLANTLLADSYFHEAGEHYRLALQLIPFDSATDRTTVLVRQGYGAIQANLGYCFMVTGSQSEGFSVLFEALRHLRRMLDPPWSMVGKAHLSLSFGYLELNRTRRAEHHGNQALELATRADDLEIVKKSLYLLGEVAKAAGDDFTAFEHFTRLQQDFHRENPALVDLLMATDTRTLINLMA